ncbi:glycosyltransferase family 39 protein, partial [bacterium]|nr:glycosyltransferase family 39 protein [bacterium]
MSTPTPNTPRRFCLSELNRRCSSKLVIWILAAVVLVSAFLVYLVPLGKTGRLEGPPRSGDGPDYDALAVQLSKGNGFAVDLNDPDYQRPYQKPSQRDQSGDAPYEPQPSPRTSRPPLLPVVMALSIKVFGRQYAPVRVIMCLFMALAATGGFLLLARRFGVVPGLIAAAWFVYFDPRSKSWAHYILTEAPACLVVMLITWCLLRTVETGSRRWAAWLGVATALGFYTRAIIAVWMPVIAIVVFLLTRPAAVRWWRPGAWRMPGMVVGLFFAVSGPWMLRNCLLLRQFEPLGTMGSASLAAAYSDEAIKKEGIWFNLTRAGFFKEVLTDSQTPLEQERIAAAY